MMDSRTILDSPGANQLVGRGDMLISTGSDLLRLQCAFIDTTEIEKITEYVHSQQCYPSAHLLPEIEDDSGTELEDYDPEVKDELFNKAARLIVEYQQGSTSLIQRKFSIGYNRAGRLIDQMEAAGIVGPYEGSRARQVLIKDLNALEQILNVNKEDNNLQ
jgi:S-DNA-T family DNA segregation ATPase FtsK/SpoIIIE